MKVLAIFIAVTLSTLFTTPVFPWQCRRALIRVGDSAGRVLKKCGKPDYRETVSLGVNSGKTRQIWYYEKGDGLPRTLIIEEGEVVQIKTGSRF